MSLRTVSYGGGVQSTALLVLAAEGQIDFRTFLFANVGDDSEHPASLNYVRAVAAPYAEAHALELHELRKVKVRGIGAGKVETLMMRLDRGDLSIPARREKDGPPMSRACTSDFKIKVISGWLRDHGATATSPAVIAMGISTDEIERAKPAHDPRSPLQHRVYPLLDLGLRRSDCEEVIRGAGLPVPPKSACWFCPFHDLEAWRSLKRKTPDLFDKACAVEHRLSEGSRDGRPVFLTRKGKPLAEVVDDQGALDLGMDGCDSGWCMT